MLCWDFSSVQKNTSNILGACESFKLVSKKTIQIKCHKFLFK